MDGAEAALEVASLKKGNGGRKRARVIFLVILLGVLCIGGAELAACRYFAPSLYEQITGPVRQAAGRAAELCWDGLERAGTFCRETADALSGQATRFWAELTAPKPQEEPEDLEEPDSQLASEPESNDEVIISDPSITELVEVDGRAILNGGSIDVVYFCQSDETWADQPYGSDHIGGYGCGPTAMAMVAASLAGVETDPAEMANWAVKHGYWARRSGSHHSIVLGAAQAFGLEGESFPSRDPEDLMAALLDGKILVALMGPGHFTRRGHFILLRGVTLTGKVLVADPNSLERSLAVWEPEVILEELSKSTNSGAPLWALWAPTA